MVPEFKCKVCGDVIKNNSAIKIAHLKKHNLSVDDYNKMYLKQICECGCGQETKYSYATRKYLRFIKGHKDTWNKGLTKSTDRRLANAKSGGWNKGLTVETSPIVKYQQERAKESISSRSLEVRATITAKQRATLYTRYGITNVNDLESGYKFRDFVLPSGNTVKIQGYEGLGILYLLEQGYKEQDLITSRKVLPKFKYNETKVYTPDLLVASHKLIVEVKSTWTDLNFKNKTEKIEAVLESGYDYLILTFDGYHKLHKKQLYERRLH
ncbi:MAG: DUF7487 domain-containing protein [Terrimicrobiaceae bacterium]